MAGARVGKHYGSPLIPQDLEKQLAEHESKIYQLQSDNTRMVYDLSKIVNGLLVPTGHGRSLN
jgi:hypothetical protein